MHTCFIARGTVLPSMRRARIGIAALALLAACGDDPAVPSVAQARAQGNGTTATVDGYVTVAPGAFESAMGNPGFALQDSSGGLYVVRVHAVRERRLG